MPLQHYGVLKGRPVDRRLGVGQSRHYQVRVRAGLLPAGETVQVVVVKPMALSNKGGIITLLHARGRKIDGVSCTREQAGNVGWTLAF